VVKKRVAPKKKPARKKKSSKSTTGARGDQSRLDLKPLQRHIRKRIKDLEDRRAAPAGPELAAATRGESEEETIERLRSALETLEDICFPSMAIPI
jgi:hypothetical protein